LIELINNQLKYIGKMEIDDSVLRQVLYIILDEIAMSKEEISKNFLLFLKNSDYTKHPNIEEYIKKLHMENTSI